MELLLTAIEERRADPEALIDIDDSILEYMIYKATKVLLHDSQVSSLKDPWHSTATTPKAELHLKLVNSFLGIYDAVHPNHDPSPMLRLRIRLLAFSTQFITRLSHMAVGSWNCTLNSLDISPQISKGKAKVFKSTTDIPNLSQHISSTERKWIEQRHNPKLEGLESVDEKQDAPLPVISLLDSIPSFMSLSAAANAMQESKITDKWMRLAAGYMAQAVVEQYVVYGCQSDKIMIEAFGWGFDPDTNAKEGTNDWIINAMFLDEDAEFERWNDIRDQHMHALRPRNGVSLLDHFQSLRENEFPVPNFNRTILQFLNGLLESQPKPLLLRVDSTTIEHLAFADMISK